MTDTTSSPDDPDSTAGRMAAIAAGLQAAGLDARVHETSGVLDITATLHTAGSKDIALIVDEDGYIELRWWSAPGAAPAQTTATIRRALAAITGPL